MKERKSSGQNISDTSILSVTKSVIEEMHGVGNSPSYILKEHYFIPFINERDGIGRLRKNSKPIPKQAKIKQKPLRINQLLSNDHKKLVDKNPRLGSVPPVGTYYQPESWIKPSFSQKPSSLAISVTSPKLSFLNTTIENSTVDTKITQSRSLIISPSLPHIKKKSSSLESSYKNHVPRRKGVWEELKLPCQIEDVRESIRFTNEVSYPSHCHERIQSILKDMRKSN